LEAKIVHDRTHRASREIVSQSQSVTHLVGDDITQPIVLLAKIAIARASRKNEDMGVQNFSGQRVVLNMRSGSVVREEVKHIPNATPQQESGPPQPKAITTIKIRL